MNTIAAVLLDLYDTLAWTEWPAMRGYVERRVGVSEARLLDAYVRTRPERSLGRFGGLEGDLRAVLQAAGVDPDPGTIRDLVERTETFLAEGVHLWDDALPVLRGLRERGVRTAIVSNCDHGTRGVVERLGLEEETDAVLLSFEVGTAKPDAGIYRAALEALGAAAHESLFVDDQVPYCDGAAALGLRTALLARDPEADLGSGAHRVIRSLGELLDLI